MPKRPSAQPTRETRPARPPAARAPGPAQPRRNFLRTSTGTLLFVLIAVHLLLAFLAFEPQLQGRLINWGYALCDVSLRARVKLPVAMATAWPAPDGAL